MKIEKLLRPLDMCCDTPEAMTHFGAVVATAQTVSLNG